MRKFGLEEGNRHIIKQHVETAAGRRRIGVKIGTAMHSEPAALGRPAKMGGGGSLWALKTVSQLNSV